MYIEPNTTVNILRNCPLNETYRDTIAFTDTEVQYNYFSSLTAYHLIENTYQRYDVGSIKVALPTDSLYNCNYMMFQNANYSSKWFYAFITDVEYVNNETSIISYTIDVLQTWGFNITLGKCLIDREHSATDVIGENTIPEDLETGPYVSTTITSNYITEYNVCILTTEKVYDPEAPELYKQFQTDPGYYGYTPLSCYKYTFHGLTDQNLSYIKAAISLLTTQNHADAIVSVFVEPYKIVNDDGGEVATPIEIQDTMQLNLATISHGTYTVKNNKIKTYPFTALSIIVDGQAELLRYELFSNYLSPKAQMYTTFGANALSAIVPNDYEGQYKAIGYTMTLTNYPLLPYTVDSFQAWLSANAVGIATGIIGDVANLYMGYTGMFSNTSTISTSDVVNTREVMYKTPAGQHRTRTLTNVQGGSTTTAISSPSTGSMISPVINDVINTIGKVVQASMLPDTLVGNASASGVLCYARLKGIQSSCRTLRPEYLKIVDDFFTLYGYKTNRVKIPNTRVRPHWTYVRTVGCIVKGGCPSDAEALICKIFDNGITFWVNGDEVGNYDLDNSPVSSSEIAVASDMDEVVITEPEITYDGFCGGACVKGV